MHLNRKSKKSRNEIILWTFKYFSDYNFPHLACLVLHSIPFLLKSSKVLPSHARIYARILTFITFGGLEKLRWPLCFFFRMVGSKKTCYFLQETILLYPYMLIFIIITVILSLWGVSLMADRFPETILINGHLRKKFTHSQLLPIGKQEGPHLLRNTEVLLSVIKPGYHQQRLHRL